MSFILRDRVQQTTTTTGTGPFALSGSIAGYQAFSAVASIGDTFWGTILQQDGDWVTGLFTYSAANQVTVTTVYESSNANAAVNFGAGVKRVFIELPASRALPASEAQAEAGTSSAALMTPQTVSQAILANALGHANIAGRNGGFEVWQRGTSVAVAASTIAYTCDGVYLATGANQACTVSQQAGLTNGSRYCARVQRNSGQTGTGALRFAMPLDIDELLKAAGRALEMIFTVSTGANWSPTSGTLNYAIYFGTGAVAKRNGSAYTGETAPISGSINLAQSAAAQQVVAAISAAVGTSVT
jgi:hypothetical protein